MTISAPTKFGIGVLVLGGVFLLGYVPATLSARDSRAEQERLTHTLTVASLQVQLGMMSYEVNRGNFGLAAELATPFFDAVRAAVAAPADPATVKFLQVLLARRDEITADLATANVGVKNKIADLYADLYRETHTPGAVPPLATGR